VARRRKLEAGDVEIDSKVTLSPTEDRGFQIGVELDVTLPSVDDDETAAELVTAAEKVCPYSNATRGNVELRLTANGTAV
jgi:organic hydroperoxide reductase OsmC/OhrA